MQPLMRTKSQAFQGLFKVFVVRKRDFVKIKSISCNVTKIRFVILDDLFQGSSSLGRRNVDGKDAMNLLTTHPAVKSYGGSS